MNKLPLILMLTAAVGLAHANLKSEFMAARQKQQDAALAKDFKAVEADVKESLAPDFKYIKNGKSQDAQTFLKNYMDSFQGVEKISTSATQILSMKETGDTGMGKVKFKMKATFTMNGKLHSMDWTGIFTDEFQKIDGKWKIATMTEGPQKFLMDGKVVKM